MERARSSGTRTGRGSEPGVRSAEGACTAAAEGSVPLFLDSLGEGGVRFGTAGRWVAAVGDREHAVDDGESAILPVLLEDDSRARRLHRVVHGLHIIGHELGGVGRITI